MIVYIDRGCKWCTIIQDVSKNKDKLILKIVTLNTSKCIHAVYKKEQGVKEHSERLNISALLCSIMRQMMQRKSLFSPHSVSYHFP